MDTPAKPPQNQESLIDDLRLVIENAQALLKNTDQYNNVLYQTARAKLATALNAATEELERFEDAQLARMIAATHAANLLHQDASGEARLLRAFHAN